MSASDATLVARAGRPAVDWRDAIHLACGELAAAGAVTSGYADRCVAMVEEHGPYIVIAPGIALAHARPEDGVQHLGVAAVTLSAPVPFDHPDNDPVDVVFAFGSPDADQHVRLLSSLASRLLDGLADELRAAADDPAAQATLETIADDP